MGILLFPEGPLRSTDKTSSDTLSPGFHVAVLSAQKTGAKCRREKWSTDVLSVLRSYFVGLSEENVVAF